MHQPGFYPEAGGDHWWFWVGQLNLCRGNIQRFLEALHHLRPLRLGVRKGVADAQIPLVQRLHFAAETRGVW